MIKNIAEIKKEYIRIGASRNGLQLEIRCINWEGPHTPVEQHIAGSKISIFFIIIHSFNLITTRIFFLMQPDMQIVHIFLI